MSSEETVKGPCTEAGGGVEYRKRRRNPAEESCPL